MLDKQIENFENDNHMDGRKQLSAKRSSQTSVVEIGLVVQINVAFRRLQGKEDTNESWRFLSYQKGFLFLLLNNENNFNAFSS